LDQNKHNSSQISCCPAIFFKFKKIDLQAFLSVDHDLIMGHKKNFIESKLIFGLIWSLARIQISQIIDILVFTSLETRPNVKIFSSFKNIFLNYFFGSKKNLK
jgi:hypothetical protein